MTTCVAPAVNFLDRMEATDQLRVSSPKGLTIGLMASSSTE